MQKTKFFLMLGVLWLSGCQTLPETLLATQLSFTAYQNDEGQRILPVPRGVGEKRQQAWEAWLQNHRHAWRAQANQTARGQTLWCAQWQQNGVQRICNRDNETLVWFGYGQSRDRAMIEQANKIWIGR